KDVTLRGTLQPEHVPQQRALARTTVSHDHENRAAFHPGTDIAHDHVRPVGHRQMLNLNLRVVGRHTGTSNAQGVGKDGEEPIKSDDSGNSCDHGAGGCLADRGSARARLHTPEAAGEGYNQPEERPLENSQQETLELNGVNDPSEIYRWRDIQHAGG